MNQTLNIWIAAIVSGLFLSLSALHVYWAVGGRWGAHAAIPEVPSRSGDGWVAALNPGKGITLVVAAGLASIAVLVSLRAGLFGAPVIHWALSSALAILAIVMLVRAVGDFRLVGFFKTVKGTQFARMDNLLYSPLCVLLGLALGRVALG